MVLLELDLVDVAQEMEVAIPIIIRERVIRGVDASEKARVFMKVGRVGRVWRIVSWRIE